ncbi:MAG: hypothetical protein OXF74_02735 [Rhodobacteraceae bacterium]|nr:hypothetical protein [Paracoccaceae bacterium]
MASAPERVAAIIRDAGGTVVGRTRLQKTAYFLDVAGYGDGFDFLYRNYGPFSEEIAESARSGALLGVLNEEVRRADWGGNYSIYTVDMPPDEDIPKGRRELATCAAVGSAIELELAATAVFLFLRGEKNPWKETERRKPLKSSDGRIKKARLLLEKLRKIEVKKPLPEFS